MAKIYNLSDYLKDREKKGETRNKSELEISNEAFKKRFSECIADRMWYDYPEGVQEYFSKEILTFVSNAKKIDIDLLSFYKGGAMVDENGVYSFIVDVKGFSSVIILADFWNQKLINLRFYEG